MSSFSLEQPYRLATVSSGLLKFRFRDGQTISCRVYKDIACRTRITALFNQTLDLRRPLHKSQSFFLGSVIVIIDASV